MIRVTVSEKPQLNIAVFNYPPEIDAINKRIDELEENSQTRDELGLGVTDTPEFANTEITPLQSDAVQGGVIAEVKATWLGATAKSVLSYISNLVDRVYLLFLRVDYISIKEYNAKCDGATGDSASINSAISYASENSLAVYVPVGTTLIDSALIIKSNVKLFGIKYLSILRLKDGVTDNVIECSPTELTENFEITSLTIDGNQANQSNGGSESNQNGICLYQTNSTNLKNFSLTNLQIKNCKKSGMYFGRKSYTANNEIVKGNSISGCYSSGIYVADSCEYLNLDGNNIYSCAIAGYRLIGSNCNITGGIVKGGSQMYGIYATVGANLAKHIINGLQINHCKTGVYLDGVALCSLTANQILASEQHGVLLNNATRNVVTSNVISGSSQKTTNTYDEVKLVASTNNIITDNMLYAYSSGNKSKYGIECDTASINNKIKGNSPGGQLTAYESLDRLTNEYNDESIYLVYITTQLETIINLNTDKLGRAFSFKEGEMVEVLVLCPPGYSSNTANVEYRINGIGTNSYYTAGTMAATAWGQLWGNNENSGRLRYHILGGIAFLEAQMHRIAATTSATIATTGQLTANSLTEINQISFYATSTNTFPIGTKFIVRKLN